MKRLTSTSTLIVVLGLNFSSTHGQGLTFSANPSGYRPPTAEEQAWFDKNATTIGRIRPNEIGVRRIQEAARERGRVVPHITAASPGEEIIPHSQLESGSAPAPLDYELPPAVDNSTLPYFPPISSQLGLNSCVAFSTTYYQFTTMVNQTINRPVNGNNRNMFSPLWTFNFVNFGGNNGTNFTHVYQILQKHGCASLNEMPYQETPTVWNTNADVWRNAMRYRIDKFGNLGLVNNETQLQQLKEYLNNGHVVAFAARVGAWTNERYRTITKHPSSGANDAYIGKRAVGWTTGSVDHAMMIVGYDDRVWVDINQNNTVDPGETGILKIANSWASGWEDRGFTYVAYDALWRTTKIPNYTNPDKRDMFVETAWMTIKPDYEPELIAQFTLHHAKRNQIGVKLGYSATDRTTPSDTWEAEVFSKAGELAFDGGTVARDGSFALDYSDLIAKHNLSNGATYRWYLQVTDNQNDGSSLTIRDFRLIDTKNNLVITSAQNWPVTVNGNTFTTYIEHAVGKQPKPVARFNFDAALICVNQQITFSDKSTNDPESYQWTFEGGTPGTSTEQNPLVSYHTAGEFNVSLTVRNTGGEDTRSLNKVITVLDLDGKIDLLTKPDGAISHRHSSTPDNEGVRNVVDSDVYTKYCVLKKETWIRYDLEEPRPLYAYSIASANDVPGRDPSNWVLEASNDGSGWVVIDQRTEEHFPERFQTNLYTVSNPDAYRYFKWNFTAVTDTIFQISELTLYTHTVEGATPVTPLYTSTAAGPVRIRQQSRSISFEVGRRPGNRSLTIYSASGAVLKNITVPQAADRITWDFNTPTGVGLARGVYFAVLTIGNNGRVDQTIRHRFTVVGH